MAIKYDLVIEAARYGANGKLEMVRAYERRGATYSDHILLARTELVARLKNNKLKCATGKRVEFMAGSFEIGKPVQLVNEIITTAPSSNQDALQDVPVF